MVDVCSPCFNMPFLKFSNSLIFSILKRAVHTPHTPSPVKAKTIMIPKDLFITRAKSLIKSNSMDCFMETSILDNSKQALQAQLYWAAKNQYMEFVYTPEIAPCREVFAHGSYIQLNHIFESFPEDRGLELVAAQCYIGTLNKDQSGHLALLGPQAISEQDAQALMDLLKQY